MVIPFGVKFSFDSMGTRLVSRWFQMRSLGLGMPPSGGRMWWPWRHPWVFFGLIGKWIGRWEMVWILVFGVIIRWEMSRFVFPSLNSSLFLTKKTQRWVNCGRLPEAMDFGLWFGGEISLFGEELCLLISWGC